MKKIVKIGFALLAIILIAGGGIWVWKYFSQQTQKENSPSKIPLNQLSDKELEKCLLEDFSRRLELQKYFVFNLNELTKEALKLGGDAWNNGRITKPGLSKDLTEIAKPYTTEWKKNGIVFLNENYGIENIDDWSGEELDKKIDSEKDYYIIFQKNSETNKICFWRGNHTSFVRVKVKPVEEHVFEDKEKALEILKTDPALTGKA